MFITILYISYYNSLFFVLLLFYSPELRLILDSVLFEPGKHLRVDMSGISPMMVPSPQLDLLATPFGLLLNELYHSPDTIINSILILLKGALACDTGAVVDQDGTNFNTSTLIIIYCSRLGARIDNYLTFMIDTMLDQHDSMKWPNNRETKLTIQQIEILKQGSISIREILQHFHILFNDYLYRLDQEIINDSNNEQLIDRNSRLASDIHGHILLFYRNHNNNMLTNNIIKSLISSFIYLTTRYTWNKVLIEEEKLNIPETELYAVLQVQRRRIITWLSRCRQGVLDEIMQTVLQVSSSLTGTIINII